jgi:4-amino-4-deoxy-L-arabinose transferase-like glycosyltransferase
MQVRSHHQKPQARSTETGRPMGNAIRRCCGALLFWVSVGLAVAGSLFIEETKLATGGMWLGSVLCMGFSAVLRSGGHRQKTYRGLDLKWQDAVHFLPGIFLILLACLSQWQRWWPWLVFFLWLAGCILLLCPWLEAWKRKKKVPESQSSVKESRVQRLALTKWWRTQPVVTRLAVVTLVILCLWGYTWRLEVYPLSIHGDEADVGIYARELMKNEPFDFFNVSWALIPRLFFYIPGVFQWLLGNDLLGLRVSTGLCGLGGLLFTGLWVRLLFGGRTAFLAVALLAMNHFYFHLSRMGASYIQADFFTAFILYLLTRGLLTGRWRALVLAGIMLAVAIMSYYSTRLIPFQVFMTYLLLAAWVRKFRVRGFTAFAVVGLVFLLAAGPLFVYFTQNPTAFLGRANVVSVFSPEVRRHMQATFPDHSWQDIARMKLTRTAWMFHSQGDTSMQYGYQGSGMLDEVTGALLILGLGVALANWKRPRYLWPILWGVMTIVTGGVLTVNTPFYPRMAVLPIFAITVCAYGFNEVLRQLETIRLPLLRWTWVLVCAVVLILAGWRNYYHYFVGYHEIQMPRTPLTTLAYELREFPPETEIVMFGHPNLGLRHGTLRLVNPELQGRDVRDPESFFRAERKFDRPQLWIFVMGRNLPFAERARELYPGGKMKEIKHRNTPFYNLYYFSDQIRSGTEEYLENPAQQVH